MLLIIVLGVLLGWFAVAALVLALCVTAARDDRDAGRRRIGVGHADWHTLRLSA